MLNLLNDEQTYQVIENLTKQIQYEQNTMVEEWWDSSPEENWQF